MYSIELYHLLNRLGVIRKYCGISKCKHLSGLSLLSFKYNFPYSFCWSSRLVYFGFWIAEVAVWMEIFNPQRSPETPPSAIGLPVSQQGARTCEIL